MRQTTKALPGRQPETTADKTANRMLTHGGAPLPVRTIQQSGAFCPSCGEHHQPGKTCGQKSMMAFFDMVKASGVVMSGNTHGNRAHDAATGRFTSAQAASSAAASGGGSATPTMAGGRAAPTTPGVGGAPKAPGKPAASPGGEPDIARAPTMQAQAPAAPAPSAAPAPAASSSSGGSPSNPTMAGVPAKKVQANKEAAANKPDPTDQLMAANAGKLAEVQEPRKAGEDAYFHHRDQALAGGASPEEAHEVGKKEGAAAWDNAVSARRARKQAEPGMGTPQVGATDHGARQARVDQLKQQPPGMGGYNPQGKPGFAGTSSTMPSGPPTANATQGGAATRASTPTVPGTGPAAPSTPARPTSIPLSPMTAPGATPQAPAPSAAPGTPAPTTPGKTPTTPGKTPGAGGKPAAGGSGINPWSMYGIGSSIGGSAASSGGTLNATAGGAVSTAHQLLHGGGGAREPAAVGRARDLQSASKKKAPKVRNTQQQVSP